MKITLLFVSVLVAAVSWGCASPQGGGVDPAEGFKIVVPLLDTQLKQGETKNVNVKLNRGEYFKQKVELSVSPMGEGVTVEPSEVSVAASDRPEVLLSVSAAENAALGSYLLTVHGRPDTGEPTSVRHKIKVVAP